MKRNKHYAFVLADSLIAVSYTHLLSDDVDTLSKETEKLLGNTNSLLEDLNKKSIELDPAVKAVADVGQSVSNVNEAVNNFVERHEERQSKFSGLTKLATQAVAMSAWRKIRQHRQTKKAKEMDE